MKKRDIGKEILEGIRDMKKGKIGRRTVINVPEEIKGIRQSMGVSQAEFSGLIGVSKRTIQEWEQGRCRPTGAARRLLLIAKRHPKVLLSQ